MINADCGAQTRRRDVRWLRSALLIGAVTGSLAAQTGGTSPSTSFLVHNLTSDLAGIADHQDPNLVNPWGNGFSSGSPFWIGDNRSGKSTLYDGTGTPSATVVSIPAAGGGTGPGPVTGVIQNAFSSNTAVLDVATGKPASFLFCSEDGLITGWAPSVNATNALVVFDNSKSGAVYDGCALGGTSAAPLIFAANFNAARIDVFDGGFNLNPGAFATAFANPTIPSGFAPFNVQNIGGTLYVAYAKQSSKTNLDQAGPGNGYVAMFNMAGTLLGNLISQGALNSPWGFAMAPASFGPFGGALLVSNFGDGTINAFSPTTGKQLGTLTNVSTGNPIVLAGLWSINFGNGAGSKDTGTLYFTAGIGGGPNNDPEESHGLLGSIQAAPFFPATGIVSGGSSLPGPIAPNEWVLLKGDGMSPVTATAKVTGTTLPTAVSGVGVTVNGEAAPIDTVSNVQIEFLVPADVTPGTAQIQTTSNGLTSASVSATVNSIAPAFFTIGTNTKNGDVYIAATHANGSLIGPAGLITGTTTTPATAGETIVIYGTGFGQTSPAAPNGQVLTAALSLPVPPTIVIDGVVAKVTFAGMIEAGVYQFNVVIPTNVATGQDVFVVGLLGNGETQANGFIAMQ